MNAQCLIFGIILAASTSPAYAGGALQELLQARPTKDGGFTTMARPLVLKLNVSGAVDNGNGYYFAQGKSVGSFPSGNKCAVQVSKGKVANGVYEQTYTQSSITVINDDDSGETPKTVGIKLRDSSEDNQLACASLPFEASMSDLQAIMGPALLSLTPGAPAAVAAKPAPETLSDDQKERAKQMLSTPGNVSFGN